MTDAEREMRRGLSALLLEAPVEVCRDLAARVNAREMELLATADKEADEAYRIALLMCTPDEPDNYGPLQQQAWSAACEEIERRITANRAKRALQQQERTENKDG